MDLAKVFGSRGVVILREREAAGGGDKYYVMSASRGRLTLSALRAEVREEPPRQGESVFIQAAYPDGLYLVEADVIASRFLMRDTGDEAVRVVVRQTGKIERIQRRTHFRVAVRRPVALRNLRKDLRDPVDMTTQNISAGGICVVSPEPADASRLLGIALHLEELPPPITCGAKIMRYQPIDETRAELGIAFRRLAQSDEDRIIRVLTGLLRELLRARG